MKEKAKTFLLILLVMTSILFTKELWIELPNKVFSVSHDDTENFISDYLLIDMIAPNKYLINFDEYNHTLFYDETKHSLWTDARPSLKSLMEAKDISLDRIDDEEFSGLTKERSLLFEFPEKLNTYILAKALEVNQPNQVIEALEEVDSIYIYLGSEEPFFVFSNESNHIRIKDRNLQIIKAIEEEDAFKWDIITRLENRLENKDIKQDRFKTDLLKNSVSHIEENKKYNYYYSMKDTVSSAKDIYIPYEMNNILPKVFVENQVRNLSEESKIRLAEEFFRENIDYIREVVEDNGSNIYIHDQKVLKLNVNGSLEYFQALDERVKRRNLYESMNTAAKFLSEISGIPKGLYLADIENIEDKDGSQGYLLTFKYRVRGIPVILGNVDVEDFIKMEIYNDHVKSYKQFMRKDMEKEDTESIEKDQPSMMSSFHVIDKNYKIFAEDYMLDKEEINSIDEVDTDELLSSIEDITLAYYDPCLRDIDEELIGVWAIRTKKAVYVFDVYTGKLVSKEGE